MALPFFGKNKKPILARCHSDELTKLRLKYDLYYRVIDGQQGTTVQIDGKDMIMLSSNDYLGLSFHPKVIEASCAATRSWGTSTNGARISNGSRRFHVALEEKLAAFLNREACHIHAAGYISVMTSVASFAQRGDLILADKNLHSCLWDGIRISTANVERFSHNNPADLREILATSDAKLSKMLVIEGVYSMEGHISRLPELIELAEEYHCFTVLDDAHGFGVLGRQGRGTADLFNLNDKIEVISGSFSKSLASTGGFVAGSHAVIEYLRTNSKQTSFSAALSPGQAAAASAALDIMQTEPEHLTRLWANTKKYKAMLDALGLDTWGCETPAVPIVLGSKERAYAFWQALMEKGVFTVLSIPPAVPPGKDLIRTAISARHTDTQIEQIAEAMAYAVKKTR